MNNVQKWLLVLATLVAFFCGGCDLIIPTYNCVYYPKGTSGQWIYSDTFSSKSDALDWCDAQMGNTEDYGEECECGRNCKSDSYGGQVCAETF